jgi:hydrogenase/urease accessory protein HupE
VVHFPADLMNQPAIFWSFLRLGIAHIWTGYDHLFFLAGLLIVCIHLRAAVGIITSFTVAHAITLGLAATDTVHLPSRVVEPLIAASIMFVGLENLYRRGTEPRGRPTVAFIFGLVHGFGFADVLRGLGLGTHGTSLAVPLFGFNLGVELGQLAVATVALPIIWRLRKSPGFSRRGIPLISTVVAATGFYWLIKRTLFY